MDQECDLCNLEKKTHWYLETSKFIICECSHCLVPMVVWKDHEFPTRKQARRLQELAIRLFPDRTLDGCRRRIPDHYHFHMR